MMNKISSNCIRCIYRIQAFLRIEPKRVVLLTGCPRSGTSAMRDWLQAQSDVAAMFEPRILFGASRFSDEVERFVDLFADRTLLLKMIRNLVLSYCASMKLVYRRILVIKEPLEPVALPDNKYEDFIRNVRAIFPGIKIIFMVREPLATIWSMSQREWGYSLTNQKLRCYSIRECIQIWQDCAKLACEYARDPDFYICSFERLVSEADEESRRLLDFVSSKSRVWFAPKGTAKHAFSDEDQNLIIRETQSMWQQLSTLMFH